jgi:uracil-DNA glycosylase
MSSEQQISLFDWDAPPTQPEAKIPRFDPAQIPTSAQIPIPHGTYPSLTELTAHCLCCQRCPLAPTRTHAVVGRGNPQAKLMLIGEGPGQTEDETGLPFVGKAGQLLEKILQSANLNAEESVYICNIVKCRPPDNRVPTPAEMSACLPYLLEQIRLVDPKIILLAGVTAVKGLIGDKRGITKIRGEWMEWQGRLCMPIFHPAYLLRNPSKQPGSPKWLMWQDIQTIKKRLDQLLDQP